MKNTEQHGPIGIDAETMSSEKGKLDNVMDSSVSYAI